MMEKGRVLVNVKDINLKCGTSSALEKVRLAAWTITQQNQLGLEVTPFEGDRGFQDAYSRDTAFRRGPHQPGYRAPGPIRQHAGHTSRRF
jgi:hypothetical protein